MSSAEIFYRAWTLVVFLASLFFVFFPQKISVPRVVKKIPPFSVSIDFAVAPCVGALLLLATCALPPYRFYRGFAGDSVVNPWQVGNPLKLAKTLLTAAFLITDHHSLLCCCLSVHFSRLDGHLQMAHLQDKAACRCSRFFLNSD